MDQKTHRSLRHIAYPYIFVLKEGTAIHDNPLDYSLMILFTHSKETIRSPDGHPSFYLKETHN